MPRWWALALLGLAACTTKPSKNGQDPAAAGNGAGMAGAGAAAGGSSADAGSSSGAVSSGGEPWVDTFDPSGCDHPDVIEDCDGGWCTIPPGCFIMGSPENEWTHAPQEQRAKTTLTRGFTIMQTEVTQEQWTSQGLANPSAINESGPEAGQGDCLDPDCPVGNVNWFEAVSYANLLSSAEGFEPCYALEDCSGEIGVGYAGFYCSAFELSAPSIYECEGYRLPTDAEWEYAARAGSKTAYYNGDITTDAAIGVCVEEPALNEVAWYCFNSGLLTHPVGELEPNAWGLFDVLGNASEWSNDQAGWVPSAESLTDPDQTFGPGQARHLRGGARYGWPSLCRLASRIGLSASNTSFGFRLARTVL